MNVAQASDPSLPRHKLDVHDYHRMAEAGILSTRDRVELIEGEIIDMPPIGGAHVNLVTWLTDQLGSALAGRASISVQNPLRLTDLTEPEPDLALLRRKRDRQRSKEVPLAGDALLVVEVADSSLGYDRDTKFPLYAVSGVPEAWLVDVNGLTLVRYRDPDANAGRYRDVDEPDRAAPLSIAALSGISVDLSELF